MVCCSIHCGWLHLYYVELYCNLLLVSSGGGVIAEDGKIVSLEHIMIFITGADREPPLGFSEKPKLEFVEGELATASTCSPTLRLPFRHPNYTTFTKFMTLSLLGHDGYGLV